MFSLSYKRFYNTDFEGILLYSVIVLFQTVNKILYSHKNGGKGRPLPP